MTTLEKIQKIRNITLSPITKVADALKRANDDVDGAIKILLEEKQADATDMANRIANASIVYSYVHDNKIGAMIVLASQTDFVSKNRLFLDLAKDICLQIVASPRALFIDESDISKEIKNFHTNMIKSEIDIATAVTPKPQSVKDKIFEGKWKKEVEAMCLLHGKFVKEDTITVRELINRASSTLGEKIELKKFVRFVTS